MYTSVHPIAQELVHWKMASWFGTHFPLYDGATETNFMTQKYKNPSGWKWPRPDDEFVSQHLTESGWATSF